MVLSFKSCFNPNQDCFKVTKRFKLILFTLMTWTVINGRKDPVIPNQTLGLYLKKALFFVKTA